MPLRDAGPPRNQVSPQQRILEGEPMPTREGPTEETHPNKKNKQGEKELSLCLSLYLSLSLSPTPKQIEG